MLAIVGLFLYTACTSDVIESPKPPDVTDTISFSGEIQPIFTERCISCHRAGGTPPNLTEGSSYASLMNEGSIDTINPAQSELYLRITPGGNSHPYKNSTYAETFLAWITQGAPNN